MTDALTTRVDLEALLQADPDARISRTALEALLQADPDARISRVNLEALLVDTAAPPTASAFRGWGTPI